MKAMLAITIIMLYACCSGNRTHKDKFPRDGESYAIPIDTQFYVGIAKDSNYILGYDTTYIDTVYVSHPYKDSVEILSKMKNVDWTARIPFWDVFKISPDGNYGDTVYTSYRRFFFVGDSLELRYMFGALADEETDHMSKTFFGKRQTNVGRAERGRRALRGIKKVKARKQ